MTLDTRIFVHGEVDVRELFLEGQRLLSVCDARPEGKKQTIEAQLWVDEPDDRGSDPQSDAYLNGRWSMHNQMDQGLPAILDITYRRGGPLKATDGECERYCSTPCDRDAPHRPAHWCEISLDTAYSYRSAIGSCTDLHTVLIHAFGKWIEEHGASFSWQNEYTGEIHRGLDGLDGFGSNGEAAMRWFQGTVRPAIALGLNLDEL